LTLGSLCSLVVLLAEAAYCATPGSTPDQARPSGIDKINHVIWIIQENRSFDNYFGTYPGADGLPPGTCLPVLPGSTQCVKPFHMPKGQPAYDLNHDWENDSCRLRPRHNGWVRLGGGFKFHDGLL